jgi:hypothetical protein
MKHDFNLRESNGPVAGNKGFEDNWKEEKPSVARQRVKGAMSKYTEITLPDTYQQLIDAAKIRLLREENNNCHQPRPTATKFACQQYSFTHA